MTKIYLGSDHAGFELKEKIKVYLEERRIELPIAQSKHLCLLQ